MFLNEDELVAEDALDNVEIVMDEQRSGAALGLLAHVQPEVIEEHHVGAQFPSVRPFSRVVRTM